MTPDEKREYNRRYYERHKDLKGRDRGSNAASGRASPPKPPSSKSPQADTAAAQARVNRLKSKVSALQGALSKANAALSAARQSAAKTEKASSDGKSTEAEKRASQEYRDKNEQKIASKEKSSSSSGGGSTSSSTSSSNSISDMSVEELTSRVARISSALRDAKSQLSNASQQLGQLAHSAITSQPMINEQFARYRSAERNPSK